MIRFEVTGTTPEEFAENAMKAWGLLAIGLQAALAQVSPPATQPSSTASSPPLQAQTSGSERSSTASKGYDREMGPDTLDDLFPSETKGSPETSKKEPAATSTKKSSTKGPKLDDLKTRLSEVIVAATERWDQKRANAYARKLLNEWRAPKLSDLAADQYEIFMQVSAAYLDGTAAE